MFTGANICHVGPDPIVYERRKRRQVNHELGVPDQSNDNRKPFDLVFDLPDTCLASPT